jgi:hypothetical protein
MTQFKFRFVERLFLHKHRHVAFCWFVSMAAPCALLGCASTPAQTRTGFISDYGRLQKAESGAMRYLSPELREYKRYMVNPVELRIQRDVLDPNERAEVATYMRDALTRILKAQGFDLTSQPGVGVATVRVAITDIQLSKWYLNLHPASKATGAGSGGASMEAEVIDSVTGKQLAAVVQAGHGNQFELDTFSKLDDVKDVIDKWADAAAARLKEMREAR